MKRVLDLLGAGTGLVLLGPALLVVGLAILIHDGRPVFFRQARVGRYGRNFQIWKFRTMVAGADRMGPQLTVAGDTRVTRLGRWLRRHKLDELPQLLNVLAGEMSLVGPRPETRRYVDQYTAEQRAVLDLVPGITDPASIAYRNESELLAAEPDPERAYLERIMPDKIRMNLAYAARATVWSDLRIVLQTLGFSRGPG